MTEKKNSLSSDLKQTIARVASLQSCATDPAHILIMTRNLMRWIKAGLIVMYGDMHQVPSEWSKLIEYSHALWNRAEVEYGGNLENWPNAMIKCSDVADSMLIIAAKEDMLDYTVLDYNYTQDMLARMGALQQTEEGAED